MDAFFEAYDRWNGLLPLLGGIYCTLLAFGYLPRKVKDPERLALWRRKFGGIMRIVGPFVALSGVITLFNGLTAEDVITKTVRQINADTPKMMDQITRLDRAEAGPGRSIFITQTIQAFKASEIDRRAWQNFLPQFRKNVANSVVGRMPSKGITVIYRFYGKDGVFLDDVKFAPEPTAKN